MTTHMTALYTTLYMPALHSPVRVSAADNSIDASGEKMHENTYEPMNADQLMMHYLMHDVYGPPPMAYSAGLGLMRWGSPNATKQPKLPTAPSRRANADAIVDANADENIASPPRKKVYFDHTTSPDFHHAYSRVYEGEDIIPEPPSVKRMAQIIE